MVITVAMAEPTILYIGIKMRLLIIANMATKKIKNKK